MKTYRLGYKPESCTERVRENVYMYMPPYSVKRHIEPLIKPADEEGIKKLLKKYSKQY